MTGLTSTTPYLSNSGRTRATTVLLAVGIVLNIIMLILGLLQINLLSEMAGGAVVPEDDISANDMRVGLASLLLLGLRLVTAVVFLLWIHRAYRNLPALGNPRQQLEYSPGWAAGYFFIPILNLFVPFRVVKEIWRKSEPDVGTGESYMFYPPEAPALIGVWWAFWIASLFADRISYTFLNRADGPNSMLTGTWAMEVALILEIIAAVLAILVVRGINDRQEKRSQLVTLLNAAPPPPPLFTQPAPTPEQTSGQ
ncbi:MAG TPA: DUF4328 domain-containing protein [Pyrinomonadaceae bacterium]|jgi:hypothetical protein|nr:DUF4328 domain-containing protein [Pyrinomonadaceae bacterium]